MPRRRPNQAKKLKALAPTPKREPAIVTAANPTDQQRARFHYAEDKTSNPNGGAVTITEGKAEVHTHKVCRRQPVYVTLFNRNGICGRTRDVLDWYDRRLGLARKGLTTDSLARALQAGGGGKGYCPTDAAMNARDDVDWARSYIKDPAALKVFDDVMEREMTISEIGGGHGSGKERASTLFKLAANWLLLGVGHRVLELR